MLDQVVTRLTGKAGLRKVEGAIALAAITGRPPQAPAAFVFPLAEVAGPNATATGTDQRVTETFGVLLVLRDAGDAKGAKAANVVKDMRDRINAELVGWQPEGAEEPIEYGGGKLADVAEGDVWWLLSYRTAYRVWK